MAKTDTIGQLLRQLRTEAGLKQADLAMRAGVSLSTVNRLEADKEIQPDKLAAISRVVGATPEQLENLGQDSAADFLRAAASRIRQTATSPATPNGALVEAQTVLIDAGWQVTLYRSGADAVVMELRLPGSHAVEPASRRTGLHPAVRRRRHRPR